MPVKIKVSTDITNEEVDKNDETSCIDSLKLKSAEMMDEDSIEVSNQLSVDSLDKNKAVSSDSLNEVTIATDSLSIGNELSPGFQGTFDRFDDRAEKYEENREHSSSSNFDAVKSPDLIKITSRINEAAVESLDVVKDAEMQKTNLFFKGPEL